MADSDESKGDMSSGRSGDSDIAAVYPAYTQLEDRIRSFTERWPHLGAPGYPQPREFALAGFFFTADEPVRDRLACAFCGVALIGWEPNDIPAVEHQFHSPACNFAKRLPVPPNARPSALSVASSALAAAAIAKQHAAEAPIPHHPSISKPDDSGSAAAARLFNIISSQSSTAQSAVSSSPSRPKAKKASGSEQIVKGKHQLHLFESARLDQLVRFPITTGGILSKKRAGLSVDDLTDIRKRRVVRSVFLTQTLLSAMQLPLPNPVNPKSEHSKS